MKWQKGYTLIEILIALTIIGILFSFGYTNFRDFSRRQSLAGVAKQLQGDLRLAQSAALAGQRPNDPKCSAPGGSLSGIRVTFYAWSYWITYTCTGKNVELKVVNLPHDEVIIGPLPSPQAFEFKPLGQGTTLPSGTVLTINLWQVTTGKSQIVTVSSNGEIK